MNYLDNDYRTTLVLNERYPLGSLLICASHLSIGLAAEVGAAALDPLEYVNQEVGRVAVLSRWPVIVLKAKNSSQLDSLAQRARAAESITVNCFASTMLGDSAADQLGRTAEAELPFDYLGVGLFGPSENVVPLTRKFSLAQRLSC